MAVQRDKVIASAEKLVAKGKIEPAIKEYERLLDDNPNDVNTLNRIGDLWVRINRNDEAVKVFAKIADHYGRDGFFLKAIAIYKKINKLDPSKLDVYAKLADLYAKQGLAMEAKSQYQVLADYYLKHGDPGNALLIYRKISELDPNSINVHVKLADLYSQNNQTAEALKEYDRVGRMLLKRGMLDEAVQVFKKALKIDAKNVELVESLVTALLEAKDYENAQGIVETALEANKNNPRLLASAARILVARGDVNSARGVLERADTSEPAVREALADLSLRQGNADKALEMLYPIAERALARGERGAAVESLNRILRVDSGHTPTLERLVGIYMKLNEETNILTAMNSLAEAHIARGRYEDAAKVLERLIQREPQNAQHRNKLSFVKSQMGGVDTVPGRVKEPPPAPPPLSTPTPRAMPAMEIEEPVPTFDMEKPALSLDLDESPAMELDLSAGYETPAAPPPRIEPAMEIEEPAPEEGGEDLDFITEHLTEAEVFAKYGLAEKAVEHLRAVIERAPKHLAAHDKLFRILLDEGEVDAARAAANQYMAILQEKNDTATIESVRSEFLARGHTIAASVTAPRRPVAPPAAAPPPPPPPRVPEPEPVEELSFDLDATSTEFEFDTSIPIELEPEAEPVAAAPESELTFEPEPEPKLEPEIELTPSIELEEEPAAEAIELESTPALEFEPESALEPETDLFIDEEPALPQAEEVVEESAELTLEPAAEPEPILEFEAEPEPTLEPLPEPEPLFVAPTAPTSEELGEVDFYIEQELFDEARDKVSALAARFPGDSDVAKRRKRLDAATAAASAIAAAAAAPKPAPPPPPLPAPPVLSRDEIESELLSAIPDDDDFIPAPPPPPAAAPPPPPPLEAVAAEEGLFADEDDFFDLAAELESEMEEEDSEQIALSEEEQSLEEIFKEFKKGVEQQLDSEDYDTHYNLGIAYKEMGLIDEAIGEFQLASKDPKRAVECASMLGLCFLEKGMPQLAIKWYRKGLEMPEISEEEHIGLLYDLGSAYMEVGDTDNAQKAFMEVYGMNSNYRDIVSRIKQLEDAEK